MSDDTRCAARLYNQEAHAGPYGDSYICKQPMIAPVHSERRHPRWHAFTKPAKRADRKPEGEGA